MRYYQVCILNKLAPLLTYHHESLLKEGSLVKVSLKNKILNAVILNETQKPSFKTLSLEQTSFYFSPNQISFANFISTYYTTELNLCFSLMQPFCKNTITQNPSYHEKQINLSSLQNEAYIFLKSNQKSLLFGDTGSGKTEIYIKLIQDNLKQNKNTIFLMPEISLTPQMQIRLKNYFGNLVAIWHSKITKKNKEQILEDIRSQKTKIIAGARSALFLPVSNLGLIIVDEEHDLSYKSSKAPFYNAKDLSLYLAKLKNAKIILGSATPSIKSFHNLPYFRLKGTFYSSSLKIIYDNSFDELNSFILQNIQETLKQNKQIIVFLPTRANFKFLRCKKCSHIFSCPFCSVGMSVHQNKNMLSCHYCGYTTPIRKICPSCNSDCIESKRIGTAEIKTRLSSIFPEAKIKQFDKDEITTLNKLNKILNDFNHKKIDILVGTQMLSKGHDYHDISLCVILGIDNLFYMPDFTANQKVLSLVKQVSGRVARKGEGKVIIQTSHESFFKKYLNDYENFLNDEVNIANPKYPPFVKILKLLISHKNEQTCINLVHECLNKLKLISDIQVIGYQKASIYQIQNKFRYQILIRSTKSTPLIKAAKLTKSTDIKPDIEPIEFF